MDLSTPTPDFFVAGGTLRADSPSYVQRPADEELFSLAAAGTFCYVLTARRLGAQGVRTALIDLTKIGTEVTLEQWYLGLVTRLKSQLKLAVDPEAWWVEYTSLVSCLRRQMPSRGERSK